MNALATQITGVGVLIFLLSLPLIYRKIPMNPFYGVRIPAAFRSEQSWYDINAYGGKLLAKWSTLIIATGIVGFILPEDARSVYHWLTFFIIFVSVLVPLIQIVVWARRRDA